MKSEVAKVLHVVAGKPLIDHVLDVVRPLKPASVVVVIGHQAQQLRAFAEGSGPDARRPGAAAGHGPRAAAGGAVSRRAGRAASSCFRATFPCFAPETVEALIARHNEKGAAATILTANFERPDGYGRIVRENGRVSAIVEHKDASPAERSIREINSGIYAFHLPPLFAALKQIGSGNAQGEYYLPDLVRIYGSQGLTVEALTLDDPREILGVNSRKELADVAATLRDRKNEELMAAGVTILDPGDDLGSARRCRRPGHGAASERAPRGPDARRRGLRDSFRRAHRGLDDWRHGRDQQLLRDPRVSCGNGRADRSVRAAQA